MSEASVSPNENKTPDAYRELWQTDEPLWFKNGRWGLCGYAMPNGQGKSWTNNGTIHKMHKLIGQMLFELGHRVDVQFTAPPQKEWWWEWQKCMLLLRSQTRAYRIDPGTTLDISPVHVRNTRKTFTIYPVPYFGGRVRQEDCLEQIEWGIALLGEIQQHSANEYADRLTGPFCDMIESYIKGMYLRVATKYFGYTADEVRANKDFKIDDLKFSSDVYKPQDKLPSSEQSVERPSISWWPTENDLSAIRGVAYTTAIKFAERWPISYLDGEGDWESTLPGIEDLTAADPIQLPPKTSADMSGKVPD